ncbi:MAG: GIY-YIG nuclease family protein, partial [Candidatus Omnitrophica bacterium]|nr:GIY-YIG nuclease family protein [Candidatus Omnitrophota bacterium]
QHSKDKQLAPKPRSPILITLPYIGSTSHKVKRIISNLASIDVVFSKQDNLKTHLGANGKKDCSERKPPRGVVYKVNCSCGKSYIGETCRPLSTRITEHQKHAKSALFEHSANTGHEIHWEQTEILNSRLEKDYQRKLMEAIQIRRHQPELNRDTGLFLPMAYDCIIN